ncbi:MAG: bifunctional oligoribonuclease/PAP phosphatase NrnA [Clostridiales bacterium]|nr:bifunctional oligoribonuclease/PAP phosphatase NrnA [Clostridiales bacterium]
MTSNAKIVRQTTTLLSRKVKEAKTIAISGHTNPDGDCVGACLGLYTYIRDQYPGKQVDILLEPISKKFQFLKYAENIKQEKNIEETYDLYFSLDCSDTERLSQFQEIFAEAKYKICIDHHVSNTGFGDLTCVVPEASSTCEILFDLFDEKRISFDCAQCLYLGLVHDTGVFKHSNTTRHVMEIAGILIEKGVRPEFIIDETFYKKTYLQNQILGRALMESILLLEGRIIFSVLRNKDVITYGIQSEDLDGVIDQLRVTEGVECALLLFEKEEGVFKVSMRSNGGVDVSKIAQNFGGGGHVKAAGCTAQGNARDIINNISQLVEGQLEQ